MSSPIDETENEMPIQPSPLTALVSPVEDLLGSDIPLIDKHAGKNLPKDTAVVTALAPRIVKQESFSKRRHSFHSHSKKQSTDFDSLEDIVLLKLELFLNHLEQRLRALEQYSSNALTNLDDSLMTGYHILNAVKESCGELCGEVIGGGWRRGEEIVKILDGYNETLGSANTLPSKVAAGMKVLEDKLSDIESQCYRKLDETLKSVDHTLIDGADVINRSIQAAIQAARHRLITYDELPAPWRENPYIIRGYRFCETYADCVSSMVKIHNETCNIWTHFLGFFIMLGIACYYYPNSAAAAHFAELTTRDKVILGVFVGAALKCLISSTIWHTFCSIGNIATKQKFACVDYTGISVLISCSILTTEYAAFYCQPFAQLFYMTMTSLFGLGGVYMAWNPEFDKPENRPLRIGFFVSLAASGAITLVHLSLTRGLFATAIFFLPICKSLLCYIVGVVCYSLLFPERFFPGGIFDWIGMSHNLWHLAVLGGILYHYFGTHQLLNKAQEFSCAVSL
ncbi:hemolysin-III related-domain-containing protein [Dipodascopsis tothii]|uniref:hemolysin-III related-domain-containing protein n=1 Tax=Dipodascopsis tothii TaxID=44089 RepID=UPI0034CDAE45